MQFFRNLIPWLVYIRFVLARKQTPGELTISLLQENLLLQVGLTCDFTRFVVSSAILKYRYSGVYQYEAKQ